MKIIAALALAALFPCAAAADCAGADPAIASVVVANVTSAQGSNEYHLSGTVVNRGNRPQASDVLQFVDIYETGMKLDAKSIPPLAPGKSFNFTYVATRSADAGKGTTTLDFRLDVHRPSPAGDANCSSDDDEFSLTF